MLLAQLDGAADWRGVVAQECAARAVAAAVRTSMPVKTAWVYCTLDRAYQKLGHFSKALEHYKEHLTMAMDIRKKQPICSYPKKYKIALKRYENPLYIRKFFISYLFCSFHTHYH
jgi:hypothetical protein